MFIVLLSQVYIKFLAENVIGVISATCLFNVEGKVVDLYSLLLEEFLHYPLEIHVLRKRYRRPLQNVAIRRM